MIGLQRVSRSLAHGGLFLLLFVGGMALPSGAQRKGRALIEPPRLAPWSGNPHGPASHLTSGDSPLTALETFAGNLDVFVEVLPYSAASGTSGTFTVAGLPAGASILRAWLEVTSFGFVPGLPVGVDFAGTDLGSKLADVEDLSFFICSLYRFDVTALLPGNGSYSYEATGNPNAYGDALVVVYSHPGLPPRTIAVHDGAEGLDFGTTVTTFEGLPAGDGELLLFAEADNTVGLDSVRLNGALVAGPADLFNANVGNYASLVSIPVTVQAGANVMELTNQMDWYGLHLAVLSVEGIGPQPIVIDFETEDDGLTALVNGQDVSSTEEFGLLVEIDGFPASGLTAAAFDSTPGGPNDPSQDRDLLVDLGNVLILQEQPIQSLPGVYDRPNDDRNGGRFEIGFRGARVRPVSIDLIDICPDPNQDALVTLFDELGRARAYTVPAGWTEDLLAQGPPAFGTLDLGSAADQPGFAATATASEDPGYDPTAIVRVEIELGGSGAIDNMVFFPEAIEGCLELDPGTGIQLFKGSSGSGRSIYLTANQDFHIEGFGWRTNLVEAPYEVVIYQGQGVSDFPGPVLATSSGMAGGIGPDWNELPIAFQFQAGQDYILNWRPNPLAADWLINPQPFFDWGNDPNDDVDLGLVTIRDGRENFDATFPPNFVAPHFRLILGGQCEAEGGGYPSSPGSESGDRPVGEE